MKHWTEGSIASDSVPIHFYRTGNGDKPPLILSHGFTDNGLCWSRTATALEDRFDVVMVDARNHGQSGAGPADVRSLAGDLARVIKSLDLGPALAMGHSVGASVVAGLAAYHGQLVAKVIFEDPPWQIRKSNSDLSREQGFRDYVNTLKNLSAEEVIAQGKLLHPSWHKDEFAAWAQSNMQVRADAMSALDLGDWQEILPLIKPPALLLYAETGIVNLNVVTLVQALNPSIETRQVKQAGHNLRRENFLEFIRVVEDYLE